MRSTVRGMIPGEASMESLGGPVQAIFPSSQSKNRNFWLDDGVIESFFKKETTKDRERGRGRESDRGRGRDREREREKGEGDGEGEEQGEGEGRQKQQKTQQMYDKAKKVYCIGLRAGGLRARYSVTGHVAAHERVIPLHSPHDEAFLPEPSESLAGS